MSDPIPLSYLVRESQRACMDPGGPIHTMVAALGLNASGARASAQNWRHDHQEWFYINEAFAVTFDYKGLDPLTSQWTYGETKVGHQTSEDIEGAAYLLDNTQHADHLTFSQDETINLHQERSASLSTEISVDIGSKTTGTIGGDAEGAKLEQEVSASLGIKTDTTEAESESKDQTTTRHIETEVAAYEATLVTIETSRVQSATPFTARGQWLAGVTIRTGQGVMSAFPGSLYYPWWELCGYTAHEMDTVRGHYGQYQWKTWDEFLQTFTGYNTETPTFTRSHISQDVLEAAGALDSPTEPYRWISLAGTQRRDYQAGAKVTIADVTGQDLDELVAKHGIDKTHIVTGGKP